MQEWNCKSVTETFHAYSFKKLVTCNFILALTKLNLAVSLINN